jgi:hypothetical protein
MDAGMEKTLLALLLALRDLDQPLNKDEISRLADIAAQLHFDPNTWESESKPSC